MPDTGVTARETSLSADVGYLSSPLYDALEASARRKLNNRVVAVFSPTTFTHVGYPTRVETDAELVKYVDVMQELRFRSILSGDLGGGLDGEEIAIVEAALEVIGRFTQQRFGTRILPTAALLSSINVFRHLRYICKEQRPTVLETGPGCGYLGLLLSMAGFRYVSTDVTQAFYLYQSQLMRFAFGQKFVELAQCDDDLTATAIADQHIIHVPWWKFYAPDFNAVRLEFDVLTGNAMFAEMHPLAFAYVLGLTRHMHARKPAMPMVVFKDWGYALANMPTWYLNSRFYGHGYALCHYDRSIIAYALQNSPLSVGAAEFPRVGIGNAHDVDSIRELGKMTIGTAWEPHGFANEQNPVSRDILLGRHQVQARLSADYNVLDQLWRRRGGNIAALNADEAFFVAVGLTKS